ncbi:MAG: uncharacterized protein JWM85_103 [Acidimicrobiaceae bacterium]|nr:uncharacterized protein [Acidimicrobiaceae bacterium]
MWRYPVKSMQGERCAALELLEVGVAGDRAHGVLDVETGRVLSAKREGRLLLADAISGPAGPSVRLPAASHGGRAATGGADGDPAGEDTEGFLGTGPSLDRALSAWLGREVRVVSVGDHGAGTFEGPDNFEDEGAGTSTWEGPPGSFADSSPVHVLTSSSLSALAAERPEIDWALRRFRPNLLVASEGAQLVESAWVGRRLIVGGAELLITKPCGRCVMTTRAQPGGIVRELEVLRHLSSLHEASLGVLARVVRPGLVKEGDPVRLAD